MRRFRRTAAVVTTAALLPALPLLVSASGGAAAAPATPQVSAASVPARTAVSGQRLDSNLLVPPTPLKPSNGRYRVRVTRTKHGIPHIVAKDWESLGYGHGYATAETSGCNLLDTMITGRGERSRWFGPNRRYQDRVTLDATNLETDLFFTDLRNRKVVEKLLADPVRGPGAEARAIVRGYIRGVNRFLRDTGGSKGFPDRACRGRRYVRPGSELDLWYGVYAANLLASAGVLLPNISSATPPTLDDPGLPDVGGLLGLPVPELDRRLSFSSPPADLPTSDEMRARLGKDPDAGFGSNATAIGRRASANGRGMILGNPHFPWRGRYRFAQAHLKIPGHYDVAGASLIGSPVINIGFNRNVAWSHTVSTAFRFTPYEYRTIPGLPTTYLTTSGLRELEQRDVTVTVRRKGGRLAKVTRTLYRTDEGYVFDAPELLMGWTPATVFAFRDANGEHLRTIDTFLEMGRATSTKDLLQRQDRGAGMPWVNTLAADRRGRALYADHSVVPNVPDDLVDQCITEVGLVIRQLAGLPVLDGTRADGACAWRDDADAQRPGIFGPANLPDTTRRDWVANANDSYWLPNPQSRLEGFAGIIGCEECVRSVRTRMVYRYVMDALKRGRISHRKLAAFQHRNRVFAAELSRQGGDLGTVCQAADGGAACDVLARWSGRDDADARGAHVFREFFVRTPADRWTVPFDPEDPIGTPRDLSENDPRVVQAMRDALAHLREKSVPVDAPLGRLQVAGDEGAPPIALGGGPGETGNANMVASRDAATNNDRLYPISYGSSHIQAVGFGRRGPRAKTILTYGQSMNVRSPWSSDQTRLFGAKRWVRFPYSAKQVRNDRISTRVLTARRK